MATPLELRRRRTTWSPEVLGYFAQRQATRLTLRGKRSAAQAMMQAVCGYSARVPNMATQVLRVRCQRAMHTVSVTPHGSIRRENHTGRERAALDVLRTLGDETCGCISVVERLMKGTLGNGPSRRALAGVVKYKQQRSALPPALRPDKPKAHTVQERRARVAAKCVSAVQSVVGLTSEHRRLSPTYPDVMEVVAGVEDAAHRAGVYVEPRDTYKVAHGGWVMDGVRLKVVVPLRYVLLAQDGMHQVERHVVYALQYTNAQRSAASALVALRTGMLAFELVWRAVHLEPNGVWRFDEPALPNWRGDKEA